MPKHFLLLIYIAFTLLSIQQTGFASQSTEATEAFGQLEYVRHTELVSVEEVRASENIKWQAIGMDQANFGFDQAHYWFRVPLINIPPSQAPWFLRSSYPLLDQLDVYLFADQDLVQEFHTGDVMPFAQRPILQPSFVFPLNINSNKSHWLYLHVYTSSSVLLPLTIQPEIQFWQTAATEKAIAAAFYAVLLCMLIYNGIIYLIAREKSYLYYVLYIASFILLLASIHGWSYQLLWPTSPIIHQTSVVFSLAITILFGGLFGSTYLRLEEIRPDLFKIVKIIVILSAIGAFLSIFIPYALAIKLNTSLALFATFFALFVTVQEWLRSHSREVLIFIIAWCTLLLGFAMFIGQKFGFLPVNNFTEHAIEIGAVLEVLILALGLAERINHEKRLRIDTQQQMLDVQIKANEELDQKVRERTEELERINSLLQLTSITDSLTKVRNRHYFDQKLPSEYLSAYREKSWISLLMIDIDHFKQFNDTHGHQAGDTVLQAVGQILLEGVKRPSDRAVRYGGEEFAIILPDTSQNGAYRVAERIRKLINELEIPWLETNLSVTVSIGVASCVPVDRDGVAALTKQADDYLYLAKERGRNQVLFDGNK